MIPLLITIVALAILIDLIWLHNRSNDAEHDMEILAQKIQRLEAWRSDVNHSIQEKIR